MVYTSGVTFTFFADKSVKASYDAEFTPYEGFSAMYIKKLFIYTYKNIYTYTHKQTHTHIYDILA